MKPLDPTMGLITSQGPIVLHIALFIGGFYTTPDADELTCKLNDGTLVGKVPSFTNLALDYLRWTHFSCAVLLLAAKLNKAFDVEAHLARFFEFVTIPLYVFALMYSFGVSKEKLPFESGLLSKVRGKDAT